MVGRPLAPRWLSQPRWRVQADPCPAPRALPPSAAALDTLPKQAGRSGTEDVLCPRPLVVSLWLCPCHGLVSSTAQPLCDFVNVSEGVKDPDVCSRGARKTLASLPHSRCRCALSLLRELGSVIYVLSIMSNLMRNTSLTSL